MFQLDLAVRQWCAGAPERVREELADHLYCEVEAGLACGLGEEQAFEAALARLGAPGALAAEFLKFNQEQAMTSERIGPVVQGILWASAIVATALLVPDSRALQNLLALMGLVAVVLGNPKHSARDFNCIKRRIAP
ncbi:MAG: permease prefix domain 1-containing protein [Pseudomonadota bacterium]